MAENVPPSTAQQTNNAADQPGRPYYESLRASLRQILEKKRKLDEQLAAVEDQIFKAEGAYLEETANSGNIVRGFDGWVKGVQVGGRGGADDRRRGRIRDEDRVFSRSSVSWMKVRLLPAREHMYSVTNYYEQAQEGTDSNPTSHAPTPTASFAPALSNSAALKAGNKKKRPTERDDDEDGKSLKRGKISYARD
jgi:chromatin modification-related protein EAF6